MQLTPLPRGRGFTLIELMVAVSSMGILFTLAMPVYRDWIANVQIRNATESVSAAIRLTQAEAIKRNGQVEFRLTPATGWEVRDLVNDEVVQEHAFTSGSRNVTITTTPATTTGVRFTGLGRMMADTQDGVARMTQVDVTSGAASTPHPLRVVVGASGVRMCDPHFASTDPTGCP